jgi:hypothetical protein
MLALHSMSGKTGFAVAWDKEIGAQKKVYAHYDDAASYYANLLTLPTDLRAGYELILPDHPARGYLDIEFITEEPDVHHTRLATVCAHYREKVRKEFGIEAEIFAVCGTRKDKDGLFKNSYHVTIRNLVFACNHDGVMKHFFAVTDNFDPVWFYTTPKGELKSIVDQAVYTPKRIMRTPLSSKKGTSVPFTRISGDPLRDVFDEPVVNDVDALIPFGISAPQGTPVVVTMSPKDLPRSAGAAHRCAKPRRPAAESNFESTVEVVPPFPLEAVKELLVSMGDTVSVISKVTVNANLENSYIVHCDQKKQARKCLHCCGLIHESNNCRLTVTAEGKVWGVRYRCFSTSCTQLHDLPIGNFSVQDAAVPAPAMPAEPSDAEMPEPPAAAAPSPSFTTWNSPFTRPPDELYSSPLVRDLPLDKRFIAVCAPCGTGEPAAQFFMR